jgi:hypothetical protein
MFSFRADLDKVKIGVERDLVAEYHTLEVGRAVP